VQILGRGVRVMVAWRGAVRIGSVLKAVWLEVATAAEYAASVVKMGEVSGTGLRVMVAVPVLLVAVPVLAVL